MFFLGSVNKNTKVAGIAICAFYGDFWALLFELSIDDLLSLKF
jgi:hypothetical protein